MYDEVDVPSSVVVIIANTSTIKAVIRHGSSRMAWRFWQVLSIYPLRLEIVCLVAQITRSLATWRHHSSSWALAILQAWSFIHFTWYRDWIFSWYLGACVPVVLCLFHVWWNAKTLSQLFNTIRAPDIDPLLSSFEEPPKNLPSFNLFDTPTSWNFLNRLGRILWFLGIRFSRKIILICQVSWPFEWDCWNIWRPTFKVQACKDNMRKLTCQDSAIIAASFSKVLSICGDRRLTSST